MGGEGVVLTVGGLRLFISALGLSLCAALSPGMAFAAGIVVFREVPTQNVLDQAPPGPALVVPVDQKDLIQKLTNDDEFGSVLASPPGGGTNPSTQETIVNSIDGSRADALATLAGSGLGSFSSLGGRISDQVTGGITAGLHGLSNAIDAGVQGAQ